MQPDTSLCNRPLCFAQNTRKHNLSSKQKFGVSDPFLYPTFRPDKSCKTLIQNLNITNLPSKTSISVFASSVLWLCSWILDFKTVKSQSSSLFLRFWSPNLILKLHRKSLLAMKSRDSQAHGDPPLSSR
jgi:hypothetical protein